MTLDSLRDNGFSTPWRHCGAKTGNAESQASGFRHASKLAGVTGKTLNREEGSPVRCSDYSEKTRLARSATFLDRYTSLMIKHTSFHLQDYQILRA
jgi:hypothetical protein